MSLSRGSRGKLGAGEILAVPDPLDSNSTILRTYGTRSVDGASLPVVSSASPTMQRRFEMYALREGVTDATVEEFLAILRGCGDYIPELLDSIAARTRSGAGVDLVWEHAYESAESYAAYMRHPYHICVLDRYLLPDAPGLITGNGPRGLGLLGYETATPRHRVQGGVRRVVAFRVRPDSSPQQVETLLSRLDELPGPTGSIAASNSMGQEWFPGVVTHLWEQTFDDAAALAAFRASPSPLDDALREGWVETSSDVDYPIRELAI